jgi:hypothetical protein
MKPMADLLIGDVGDADTTSTDVVPGNATTAGWVVTTNTDTVARALDWWSWVSESNKARADTAQPPVRPRWRSGHEVLAALNAGALADPGLAAELDAHAATLADMDDS